MVPNEADRRKQVIDAGRTDVDRWADPSQLEAAWEARAIVAADFIPSGTRVLDIGCGAMKLERHLPWGCTYLPADVVPRDDRTLIVELNAHGVPTAQVSDCDLVVMLGVWEYLYEPRQILSAFAGTGKPLLCSYCTSELTTSLDRRALGWVNDFSITEFTDLARECGYTVALQQRIDPLQYLFRLTVSTEIVARPRKRVHVLSFYNVGNFGDRLGYHVLNSVLPPHAEVTWGTFRPFAPPSDDIDLLIIGIGNSVFGDLLDDALVTAPRKAKASIGIFGTQYRPHLDVAQLDRLLGNLTHWFARTEDDVQLYGRNRSNVSHLGDWLINAFPLSRPTNPGSIKIGEEIWNNLPLDRVIQQIQTYKIAVTDRLHPLLCALTSAEQVGYMEQRLKDPPQTASGKFRSMFLDVFGRTFPEKTMWAVDRDRVAAYKARVRCNTDDLERRISELLG